MRHLLLALLLITPSAVRAGPLWAFVQSVGFKHKAHHYIDINSLKTLGEVTYFNEKISMSGKSWVETHQVNCVRKQFLYNSQIEGADVFWREWAISPGFQNMHLKTARFVCNAVSSQ